MMKSIWKTY